MPQEWGVWPKQALGQAGGKVGGGRLFQEHPTKEGIITWHKHLREFVFSRKTNKSLISNGYYEN